MSYQNYIILDDLNNVANVSGLGVFFTSELAAGTRAYSLQRAMHLLDRCRAAYPSAAVEQVHICRLVFKAKLTMPDGTVQYSRATSDPEKATRIGERIAHLLYQQGRTPLALSMELAAMPLHPHELREIMEAA